VSRLVIIPGLQEEITPRLEEDEGSGCEDSNIFVGACVHLRWAAADKCRRAGRTPRARAMTRGRMNCVPQQHLFLGNVSLTEADPLTSLYTRNLDWK
jgi:hypothetical protein